MNIENVLTLAKLLAAHEGKEVSTISTVAANGGHVFTRLEAGKRSATERKLNAYGQWFSDNWPADLAWPDHIDRPAKSSSPEEEDAA